MLNGSGQCSTSLSGLTCLHSHPFFVVQIMDDPSHYIDPFCSSQMLALASRSDRHSGPSSACPGCQECVAIEGLLTMGRGSPCQRSTKGMTEDLMVGHKDALWSQPLTPPPSEAGSMSPPQSCEDSWDCSDLSKVTETTPMVKSEPKKEPSISLKRKSMLVQVSCSR